MSEANDIAEMHRLVETLKANGTLAKAQQEFAREMKNKLDEIINDVIVNGIVDDDNDIKVLFSIKSLDITKAQLVVDIKFDPSTIRIDLAEDDGENDSLYDDLERIFKKFVNRS